LGNEITQAVMGSGDNPDSSTAEQIGKAAAKLEELADALKEAKADDTGRYNALKEEQVAQAAILNGLKAKAEEDARESDIDEAIANARDAKAFADAYRSPSKARLIGSAPREKFDPETRGAFLYGVHESRANDYERQIAGKAIMEALRTGRADVGKALTDDDREVLEALNGSHRTDRKAYEYEDAWGKATLGTTDATGGWVIPNAVVDEFIKPGQVDNIYRTICTVVPGVTAFAVDIPFRSAIRTRAAVKAFGQTKENLDLAYNG
jgi:hypothetical protein